MKYFADSAVSRSHKDSIVLTHTCLLQQLNRWCDRQLSNTGMLETDHQLPHQRGESISVGSLHTEDLHGNSQPALDFKTEVFTTFA